ncbi:MAG TPA: phage/plasmid primase, P4 family [Trebonia sp.]|nr:phage/plasmid primase, P4 family [Trebonia sp.]
MTPDEIAAHIGARGGRVIPVGRGTYKFSCPVPTHGQGNGDRNPSASISPGSRGRQTILCCHAGCDELDIITTLGLRKADMFPPKQDASPGSRRKVADYRYEDADGRLLYGKERWEPGRAGRTKECYFYRELPTGKRQKADVFRGPGAPRRVIFRLRRILDTAARGGEIYWVEGEKSVIALEKLGIVATTAGACTDWRPDMAASFKGASLVRIIADYDEPGMAHARKVAAALDGIADRVEILRGRVETDGADVIDHLEAGHTLDELVPIDGPPAPEPTAPTKPSARDVASRAKPGHVHLERDDASMTDAMLAELIAREILTGRYCWSAGLGWLHWTGKQWKRCDEVEVIEPVRKWITDVVTAELPRAADDWRKRLALTGLLSRGRISAVVSLSRGIVRVDSDAFDAHPDLLNTPTGIVDLTTGSVLPHDPELLLTKMTTVGYVPGATHPDWAAALEAVPESARGWLQVRLGQSMTGHMAPDDVLLLMQGGGENGKSTVMGTLMKAAGDYHVLVSDRVLMADPGAHPTELMDFRGARLAVAEELPEARRLSVKRLKDTVGTPRMKARYIRENTCEWEATHALFLSTNYLPIVEETDHGTWRRLLLLKFPYKFLKPHEELSGALNERMGDPGLRERLRDGDEQKQTAMAWLVEGARRWYQAGRVMPRPPEQVETDTRAWRAESDQILGYWADRIEPMPGAHVMARDLFDDFNAWLSTHGHQKWSDKTFVSRFGGHDETARHRLVRKQIRRQEGLSRPAPGGAWADSQPPVPSVYWAWMGVQFTNLA